MNKSLEQEQFEQDHSIFGLRQVLKSHFLNRSLLNAGGFLTVFGLLGGGAATPIGNALQLEHELIRLIMLIALAIFVQGVTLVAVSMIHCGGNKNRTPAYFFQFREILAAIDVVDAVYVDRAKNDGNVVNPRLVAFGNLNRVNLRDIDQLVELKRKMTVAVDRVQYLDDIESTYMWLKDARVEPTKLELKALQKAISDKK